MLTGVLQWFERAFTDFGLCMGQAAVLGQNFHVSTQDQLQNMYLVRIKKKEGQTHVEALYKGLVLRGYEVGVIKIATSEVAQFCIITKAPITSGRRTNMFYTGPASAIALFLAQMSVYLPCISRDDAA